MFLSNRGHMGLRVIVFMGAATFLLLMLMAFGLKKSLQPQAGARVPAGAATSPFQEDRAWRDVDALLKRAPATKEREDYVTGELRKAGLKTRRIPLENAAPTAGTAAAAIVGVIEGGRPGVILLCTALSTPSMGVDSGPADGAWLLEMARVLGRQRDGRSLWMVFLSGGQGARQDDTTTADQAGRQLIEALKTSQELDRIDAVLAVRGIGDCALAVQKEVGAPPELSEILWNTAVREGYEACFSKLPARVQGAHLSFRENGVPALALVDGNATRPGRVNASGTSQEPEEWCRESLRAVGDVIYHALPPIEGHLDETGMRIDGH